MLIEFQFIVESDSQIFYCVLPAYILSIYSNRWDIFSGLVSEEDVRCFVHID